MLLNLKLVHWYGVENEIEAILPRNEMRGEITENYVFELCLCMCHEHYKRCPIVTNKCLPSKRTGPIFSGQ